MNNTMKHIGCLISQTYSYFIPNFCYQTLVRKATPLFLLKMFCKNHKTLENYSSRNDFLKIFDLVPRSPDILLT